MPSVDRRKMLFGSAAMTTGAGVTLAAGAALAAEGAAEPRAKEDPNHNPANPRGATSSKAFPNLFSPITVGGMHLKNRIAHAAIVTYPEGTPQHRDYHANRARGGAAMIVIPQPRNLDAGDDAVRRLADAVERHDCRLVAQLNHGGRGRHEPGRLLTSIGPSSLPCDISWSVPHALSTDEVKRFIEDWARTAKKFKEAGISGVEIHASQGHLVHEFLSSESNTRDDGYGGDLKARTRFLTEIVSAVRAACGRPFIIGVKMVGEDGVPGGVDLNQSKAMIELVHATGEMDYLTFGWGSFADTLYWHAPGHYGPRMPYLEKQRALGKAAPGVPLGATGLITDPTEGEHIVRNKLADLVFMGRPLTSDAAWALKASEGRTDEIRKCVSCNTCWQITGMLDMPIKCDNNPRVATPDEADWKPVKAAKIKRVVIVGAGPAGLEAAWTAAARGHDVTLFSASAKTGGKLRLQAGLPNGAGYPHVFDFQRHMADRHGVKIVSKTATADDVLALHPDAVILATGSRLSRPGFLPPDGAFQDLRSVAAALLAQPASRRKGNVVIYDYDHTLMTYSAAEYLAALYDRVALVTPRDGIAGDESIITRQAILHRFSAKKIEIVTASTPLASSPFAAGKVICRNSYNGSDKVFENVALFTYATPRVPNDELAAALRAKGTLPQMIGDCWAPRQLLTATGDGHKIGTSI